MYRHYQDYMDQNTLKNLVYENTPIDTILRTYEDRNFVEVTGMAGGDTMTYRIYNNGTVVER